MPIDFKRVNDKFAQNLEAVQTYQASKEMLKELAKYLPTRVPYAKWKQIDTEMDGEPTYKLVDVFQRVVHYDFRWTIGLLPKPAIKPGTLLNKDQLQETPLWTLFGRLVGATGGNQPVVVLFKCSHRGIWVMHNTTPASRGLYVCIPATAAGLVNISIEPLEQWAERNFGDA